MSADAEEVLACYRFDGLERWTVTSLEAWSDSLPTLDGWLQRRTLLDEDRELAESATDYLTHLTSGVVRDYLAAFAQRLRDEGRP